MFSWTCIMSRAYTCKCMYGVRVCVLARVCARVCVCVRVCVRVCVCVVCACACVPDLFALCPYVYMYSLQTRVTSDQIVIENMISIEGQRANKHKQANQTGNDLFDRHN
jgi:hypothetical protein